VWFAVHSNCGIQDEMSLLMSAATGMDGDGLESPYVGCYGIKVKKRSRSGERLLETNKNKQWAIKPVCGAAR
jgi:hypothetical protein